MGESPNMCLIDLVLVIVVPTVDAKPMDEQLRRSCPFSSFPNGTGGTNSGQGVLPVNKDLARGPCLIPVLLLFCFTVACIFKVLISYVLWVGPPRILLAVVGLAKPRVPETFRSMRCPLLFFFYVLDDNGEGFLCFSQ